MALVPNLVLIAGAIAAALCGISMDYAKAVMEVQKVDIWDRVSVKDSVELYGNEKRENEESVPPVGRWIFARFLEKSSYGTQKLRFADGSVWWADMDDFWPVYKVTGPQPVEIVGIFAKEGYEKAKKNESDKLEQRHVGWIGPGELVAVNSAAQAPLKTYLVITEDGLSGYADMEFLEPVGDTGWR